MALLCARLGSMSELRSVFVSMHRYPALGSGVRNCDAEIATALNSVAKRGADGCLGVALERSLGIATEAWDGSDAAVEVGAIAAFHSMGCLTPSAAHHLQSWAQPPIGGGGRIVGKVEAQLELLMS
jgi:L-asparaginase II